MVYASNTLNQSTPHSCSGRSIDQSSSHSLLFLCGFYVKKSESRSKLLQFRPIKQFLYEIIFELCETESKIQWFFRIFVFVFLCFFLNSFESFKCRSKQKTGLKNCIENYLTSKLHCTRKSDEKNIERIREKMWKISNFVRRLRRSYWF